ncbi:glutamate synthase large subunit [Acetobacteraceae bacterium]|nr:glutamate synthase large subunit [Acetobacteraceae bacterium]
MHPENAQNALSQNRLQTESEKAFIQTWQSNKAKLEAAHIQTETQDACGVGLIAALDGKPSRKVVLAGIEALSNIWHRGAVDADGKTGDGSGIHIEIPQDFFAEAIYKAGKSKIEGKIALGMVFLPRNDLDSQEHGRQIIETEILRFGYEIYGWRQVPINTAYIGEKANATRPEIEQIMIRNALGKTDADFERDLYIIRRRIEKAASKAQIDLYLCSLSCRSVIYKGMFLAENLVDFFPDLLDERFVSRFALYHQRYSTNTFPTWKLAQPFRRLAHNGEINTLSGNINLMQAQEVLFESPVLDPYIEDLKPVIQPAGSDTAVLDNVFELLTFAGREAPAAKNILIPAACGPDIAMAQSIRDYYLYCNAVMPPWDGPAAICGTDGRWMIAGLDRSGLRPLRYTITHTGLLIVGSESGIVRLKEEEIAQQRQLGPGETLAFDMENAQLYFPAEMQETLSQHYPFPEWLKKKQHLAPMMSDIIETAEMPEEELHRRKIAANMTYEQMEIILDPMMSKGIEALGSMGDDTPLQVLSNRYRGLPSYFRQRFSQVTNPPIDPLRETRVMSLATQLGRQCNILSDGAEHCSRFQLASPILSNGQYDRLKEICGEEAFTLDATFALSEGENGLKKGLQLLRTKAEAIVRAQQEKGKFAHLFLTTEHSAKERVSLPIILAIAAVHTHLMRQKLSSFASLNVRSACVLDTHSLAVCIGVGATTINPFMAEHAIAERVRQKIHPDLTLAQAVQNYLNAANKGLLKIMSKAGISLVSAYRGGYNFEAIGLSRALSAEFFPGMPSRLSGIGLHGIARHILKAHQTAWQSEVPPPLPAGGRFRQRPNGEEHALSGEVIRKLQKAVKANSFTLYQEYVAEVQSQKPIALRDLLDFKPKNTPISVDEVEGITSLRKRLIAPGISLGALSPEAHETLAIAMNRIGAKSDSGEGGEDPQRAIPRPNGDNPCSQIKQVASGRFGVTAEYLNNCREIEIKVAQGAKPGEGGQLPGYKVTELIAKLRHATPGVTLISPPPHHDIYSIEDLAQLIYDLKQINPTALVTVKMVSRSGIGTIAAGVAKAKADGILISGYNGGTGASPLSSIHHAGLPWEMGLAETHQMLMLNRLRHRMILRVDGGIKTGRDIVIAAMLGAEEFGIGTASLIAMGCLMVRQCHSNTCPVGVCVQDPELRKKFAGKPEDVINLFTLIAEDVRHILAKLGVRSLKEIIGRSDLLCQVSRGAEELEDLDLNALLVQADEDNTARYCTLEGRNEVPDSLDAQIIQDAAPLFERQEKLHLHYQVRNTHRAVGTAISSKMVRQFGMKSLQDGHLTLSLKGTAGQSLGAFGVKGLKIQVEGDANDYVGKGLSGAIIALYPARQGQPAQSKNSIAGNTLLYGATSGSLFAAGHVGERFAVRNSGATGIVEGCGSNACEYMTGGIAVILGETGDNFGAGFTGGEAFVLDRSGLFESRLNRNGLNWHKIEKESAEETSLRKLVERHLAETGSAYAENLLQNWEMILPKFWHIIPKDYEAYLRQQREAQ